MARLFISTAATTLFFADDGRIRNSKRKISAAIVARVALMLEQAELLFFVLTVALRNDEYHVGHTIFATLFVAFGCLKISARVYSQVSRKVEKGIV